MAGELSNEGEKLALQKVFIDTTTYVMLLSPATGAFTISDTSTLSAAAAYEVPSNTGYVRKAVTWAVPSVVSGAGTISNSAQIDFGSWLVDQGANKISQIAIVDAASGTSGKILAWFTLAAGSELQPVAGQPVRIPASGLTISID